MHVITMYATETKYAHVLSHTEKLSIFYVDYVTSVGYIMVLVSVLYYDILTEYLKKLPLREVGRDELTNYFSCHAYVSATFM